LNIWLIKKVLPTRLRPYNATNSGRALSTAAFSLFISDSLPMIVSIDNILFVFHRKVTTNLRDKQGILGEI
jgi:hypothetical protein